MGRFKKLEYFDEALQRTSEEQVMKKFHENLREADLYVLQQKPFQDWRTVFCVEHYQTLKQKVLESL